jgi:tetratricopeptide (TPR) repeat protein
MLTQKMIRFFQLIFFLAICFAPTFVQNGWSDYSNPVVGNKDNAAYWLDRGGLFSTYGNYPAAVKAYKKALELDSRHGVIYYDLSLAYCEMNAFEEALTAIGQALAKEPENGRYYYAKAWILLRAGRTEEARPIFQKAADLGDQEAKAYLERN